MSLTLRIVIAVIGLLAGHTVSAADGYPSRTVRVVVPLSAGGSADQMTRPVLERLGARLGQQFLLENRPGAGGEIGSSTVAKAPPDGYTLLVGAAGPMLILPELRKMSYDAQKEFVPVAWLGEVISGLAVNVNVPAKTVRELIDIARQKPGTLAFPSAGYGTTSHLRGELLALQGGVKFTHVPYKSNVDAVPDLVSGRVHMMFESLVFPYARAGKLRLLAVLTEARYGEFPETPTMREAGFPEYSIPLWYAIYAPAATPRPVQELLNREIAAILGDAEFREKMRQQSFDMRGLTLAGVQDLLGRQRAMYQGLLKRVEIKLE